MNIEATETICNADRVRQQGFTTDGAEEEHVAVHDVAWAHSNGHHHGAVRPARVLGQETFQETLVAIEDGHRASSRNAVTDDALSACTTPWAGVGPQRLQVFHPRNVVGDTLTLDL